MTLLSQSIRPVWALLLALSLLSDGLRAGQILAPVASVSPEVAERIARLESRLLPAILVEGRPAAPMALTDRMARHRVPGVSVAVLHNGIIEWARGYGVLESGRPHPVTAETLFQAASISKPVAAAAALKLVEQGRLSLDEDLNSRLRSWRIPASDPLQGKKVTLRQLLTHSAGLTVSGFRGYAAGDPVPTLLQILEGEEPANSAPIRVDLEPGRRWRYSGGGFTVLQQLLIDVTGVPFADFLQQTLLVPLGMRHSSYEQPLPSSLHARAAVGHDREGRPVAGKWYTYPEQAAAGLWTTPGDLLLFAIELQRAWNGRSSDLLPQPMARQMLQRQVESWGLGLQVAGQGDGLHFQHGGSNQGYRCIWVAYAARGQGAAIMTNSDNGPALFQEILRAVAVEYEWPDFRPATRKAAEVSAAVMESYAGEYERQPGTTILVRFSEGRLFARQGEEEYELVPDSETGFFSPENGAGIRFERNEPGEVTGMVYTLSGRSWQARRLPSRYN